ncbi:MAG: SpoIIE family protein phosphatase [Bacteroidetes bacterium]|nr:SpoIIE family protein phosphatase [Bacteroidota bacterium]
MNTLKYSIALFFLYPAVFFAQLDSLSKDPKYKEHLSFKDTFLGDEDMYQVCYPKGHRTFFYFIFFLMLLTLVLAALIIYNKNKNQKKLKEKNSIISEKNKELTDSITYAKRIQQALLPDANTLNNLFFNGFILYKPKNIVSGDFYWLHKTEQKLFIALFDCTGHGVPGAFLTMLAYNAVSKTVIEKGITEPSRILNTMNLEVKNALKQAQEGAVQDGMEAAILCINYQNNEITFSGANLCLQAVQQGVSKIISSGKCSVGSSEQAIKLPETISLQAQSGDCFYLYSDGYADQFGGPKGKKLKQKQLEKTITDNASLPIAQQQQVLEKTLSNWQGILEQTDDITVLGIKM